MIENFNESNAKALEKLSREVSLAQESSVVFKEPKQIDNSGMALGMRMASEFVSAIIVGALLGYGADYWLKTLPIGLIIGLGIGFAAGVVNLIRAADADRAGKPIGEDLPSSTDDEEE